MKKCIVCSQDALDDADREKHDDEEQQRHRDKYGDLARQRSRLRLLRQREHHYRSK